MEKTIDLANPKKIEKYVHVHIGKRLRHYRLLSGLSQEDMARVILVTFQQYQKYEHGVNRISPGKLYVLAHVLHLPVASFFPQNEVKDYVPTPPRVLQIMRLISPVAALHPDEMAAIAKALTRICENAPAAEE